MTSLNIPQNRIPTVPTSNEDVLCTIGRHETKIPVRFASMDDRSLYDLPLLAAWTKLALGQHKVPTCPLTRTKIADFTVEIDGEVVKWLRKNQRVLHDKLTSLPERFDLRHALIKKLPDGSHDFVRLHSHSSVLEIWNRHALVAMWVISEIGLWGGLVIGAWLLCKIAPADTPRVAVVAAAMGGALMGAMVGFVSTFVLCMTVQDFTQKLALPVNDDAF